MKKFNTSMIWVITVVLFFIAGSRPGLAVEPAIADYSAIPVFLSQSAKPNVMIILDNSGSMNVNAFGSAGPWLGEPIRADFIDTAGQTYIGWIVGESFAGEPYYKLDVRVSDRQDDAQEQVSDGAVNTATFNLDLGRDGGGEDQTTGLRFKNVQIPQGATLTKAHIEFNTQGTYLATEQDTLQLTIYGEDINDAKRFENTNGNISGRSRTGASVSWTLEPLVEPWDTAGDKHQTPELKTIVQEIVDRKGWSNGSPMAFIITKEGSTTEPGRKATAHDVGPSTAPLLHFEVAIAETTQYYGYFNPDYFYVYNTDKFVHKYRKLQYSGDPATTGLWKVENLSGTPVDLTDAMIVSQGLWDGNWLNWLAMRRIDVLRKVLMGGKSSARTGGGNQVNYGENSTKYVFIKQFDSSAGSAATPYDGNYYYAVRGDKIYVIDGGSASLNDYLVNVVQGVSLATSTMANCNIHVQKNVDYEPADFHYYDTGDNLAGILQKLEDRVRWGTEFFYEGTGSNLSGGYIDSKVGTAMNTLINGIETTSGDTWTPLAESFYTAMQYFKQQTPDGSLDYETVGFPCNNPDDDPYYHGTEYIRCAKGFVILLTDGAATKDRQIPAAYIDYDADGTDAVTFDCDASDHLDDLALYAHTEDLRSASVGKSDLEGKQNLTLFTIYAFGDDDDARQLLKDAAKNGGFKDQNGNDVPDGDYSDPPADRLEWDADGDGNPDTYFEASGGHNLEKALLQAITDIIKEAASGTAASVLATNTEGEGNMVQAYFRPTVSDGLDQATWLGYLQSLWVDEYGNLREDTVGDKALDVTQDKVIKYFSDVATGDTKVKKYTVSAANPYPDTEVADCVGAGTCLEAAIEEIKPIFEAGKLLAQRPADDRKIFTYVDKNDDGVVDEATYNSFDTAGEVITFDTIPFAQIQPYLGVAHNTVWSYLGATHDDRAVNLIEYIRGKDAADLTGTVDTRNRTLSGTTWKLGDIVHSTPASIAKPVENYHIIYKDESYQHFFDAVKNRETMIYVGANDGMLHAFTSWKYSSTTGAYSDPYPANGEQMGEELWAFIPQSLLPHLKWLPHPNYTHSYYVDLMPRVFDAKILPDDTHYTDTPDTDDNWGTFLLGGLNMGGKHIWSEGDYGSGVVTRDFYPSYFLMDITDPRNPRLLWERTYTNLAMSRSVPAVVKVGDTWLAVFGSGPTDYEGNSSQNGYIFAVDLKTGAPYGSGGNDWLFGPLEANAFMNSPAALDMDLNNNVDGIYFGEAYLDGISKGKVYKVTVPCTTCEWDAGPVVYDSNPLNWNLSALFNCVQPITAPLALSVDSLNNAWVYVGTGRYIGYNDKVDAMQQYIYGIKDPFFNENRALYYHDFTSSLTLDDTYLFDADPIVVTTAGTVIEGAGLHDNDGTWHHLLDVARSTDGWVRSLETSGGPSERAVSKSAVLGGTIFSPTFTPNSDACEFGGDSNFYALHFETGTAYTKQIFNQDNPPIFPIINEEIVQVKLQDPISGAPPPRVGMHVGREKGARAYLQQSTGQIIDLQVSPFLYLKSGLTYWHEE